MVKNLSVNAGDTGDEGWIPGLGRCPAEGNGNPFQYSFLENPKKRSLVGYSPWGQKQLEITEHAHTPTDVVLTHVSGPILIMESQR